MVYREAAKILEKVGSKKASVKSLVLGNDHQNKKLLMALVCETLKFDSVLTDIIDKVQLMRLEKKSLKSEVSLAKVLVYDFLFGKGLHGAPKPLRVAISNHKSALKSELAKLKVKAKVTKNVDLVRDKTKGQVKLPRYVRVNLLKTSVQEVIQHFRKEGFSYLHTSGLTYERYVEAVRDLKEKEFTRDLDLPDLLTFCSGTDLHDHVLYVSGDIILQDKASCIPASVLAPPAGAQVIDCCAAPGNKTSHAAAIMANKGKIYSFDLDARRLATMNTLTLRAGVLCAQLTNADFLTVDTQAKIYSQVEYLIVDPSCSGSGIINRLGHLTDDDQSASSERLENLANFQVSVLKHALAFPAAKRVVYSTCSVHQEENEDVVKQVLSVHGNQFKLVKALPGITSRGLNTFKGGDKCIRLSPKKDNTNGFFVACFERRLPDEEDDDDSDEEDELVLSPGGKKDDDNHAPEDKSDIKDKECSQETLGVSEKINSVEVLSKSKKKRMRKKLAKEALEAAQCQNKSDKSEISRKSKKKDIKRKNKPESVETVGEQVSTKKRKVEKEHHDPVNITGKKKKNKHKKNRQSITSS